MGSQLGPGALAAQGGSKGASRTYRCGQVSRLPPHLIIEQRQGPAEVLDGFGRRSRSSGVQGGDRGTSGAAGNRYPLALNEDRFTVLAEQVPPG